MAKARVWSEVLQIPGTSRRFRHWRFAVTGKSGVVLCEDGYGTHQLAFTDALELARAVHLVEERGHQLKTWRQVVDELGGERF